jgi:hypothetical protein
MSRRAGEDGCAVCGAATAKRPVSPLEEVSARYCDDCQGIVGALEGLAGAGPVSDQALFHLVALERLRRLEMVAHDLVRRRIQAARVRGAAWDGISDAAGMPEDEIKRTYPLWDTEEKNWGWG